MLRVMFKDIILTLYLIIDYFLTKNILNQQVD